MDIIKEDFVTFWTIKLDHKIYAFAFHHVIFVINLLITTNILM